MSEAPGPWGLACLAAAVIALDPAGLKGVHVKARAGPARDRWLERAAALSGNRASRRIAPGISDGRLTGGLDIGASLEAGRPIVETGILAACDGGVLVIAMAERLSASAAGIIGMTLDDGTVRLERDGISARAPARFSVLALDEGDQDDDPLSPLIADRLGLRVALDTVMLRDLDDTTGLLDEAAVARARTLLPQVTADDAVTEALCRLAMAFGGHSMRQTIFLSRAAKAVAALRGSVAVEMEDAVCAGRLVFGASLSAAQPEQNEGTEDEQTDEEENEPQQEQEQQDGNGEQEQMPTAQDMAEMLVQAVQAALPKDLLSRLGSDQALGAARGMAGKAGALKNKGTRGRAVGVTGTPPTPGSRIDVPATLRAAAPWQGLRAKAAGASRGDGRLLIRKDDFRYIRFREKTGTLAIFAVDASGSSAIERLAEAKGAVELLLAQCYVRRDSVALIAFRGRKAETLLEPTRSLVRAKRSLSALPGGGGTPLADGILSSLSLALGAVRKGQKVMTVMLTDGRGNIALDGTAVRERAQEDAQKAARRFKASLLPAILIDTAQRPQARAETLARDMGADYLALPRGGSTAMAREIGARLER